jgi:hypothetical protein
MVSVSCAPVSKGAAAAGLVLLGGLGGQGFSVRPPSKSLKTRTSTSPFSTRPLGSLSLSAESESFDFESSQTPFLPPFAKGDDHLTGLAKLYIRQRKFLDMITIIKHKDAFDEVCTELVYSYLLIQGLLVDEPGSRKQP